MERLNGERRNKFFYTVKRVAFESTTRREYIVFHCITWGVLVYGEAFVFFCIHIERELKRKEGLVFESVGKLRALFLVESGEKSIVNLGGIA